MAKNYTPAENYFCQENLVTWLILKDKDMLEELVDSRLEGKYPKEDFIRVCTIAAACVAPEASQRPTMTEVVQSLKMVQRVVDQKQLLCTFSTGPYSGLSGIVHENITRTTVFSEDLHEGR
ncbi:unnamed protein product [Brassica oleracea var. botrytis]|uniref:Serine-threonine/tyrosine-protein kinase catalytic domain-containing protein n=1 Tax=Brassica oleracea TaxID=3712 RepID=A0A3P6D9B8_BRAOL|nr:unnamed protein product [Brassica oleracea]